MMVGKALKRVVKRGLAALGYTIRGVGRGVGGVDLLHDSRILIGDGPGAILFDVGANIGQTTQAMLNAFRCPRVYAFEPSPNTVELLRRAVAGRGGVTVEAIAMGNAVGTLPFHVTRDHSVNDSILTPTWEAGGSVVEVQVQTIDTYCDLARVDVIDLLKIDTQGYDLQVLQGARGMLNARRIRMYSCEANLDRMYEGQATLRDFLVFADEVGFRLVGFYEQTYIRDRLSYLDALFCVG